ncbi:hypothetical protein PCA10_23260 [Metapseudomonas resinovorans NBRC 106553]|uniref:Uncharacterized protein n=1 Tax=Metapseudomonas resinovorans NBRC 106553 TaxID=1245471 RepID=S6AQM2_METRE|nr:hypothetical protein PCA10_23260 [Pseudomonas resinovorans NBRC 106553]
MSVAMGYSPFWNLLQAFVVVRSNRCPRNTRDRPGREGPAIILCPHPPIYFQTVLTRPLSDHFDGGGLGRHLSGTGVLASPTLGFASLYANLPGGNAVGPTSKGPSPKPEEVPHLDSLRANGNFSIF